MLLAMNRYVAFACFLVMLGSCRTSPDTARRSYAPAIFMIGDSTMANKRLTPPQPERGWGQLLPVYFKPEVRIVNLAANGRSSKSFRDEGRWQPVLNQLRPGDYVIIQFGHNDQKPDAARHTEPFGSFADNLTRYIQETRAKHGIPILATPIVRRAFTNGVELIDTHGDYVLAVRHVAVSERAPLLELNGATDQLVRQLGPDLSRKLFMWIDPGEYPVLPAGKKDDTHLNPYGASRVCDLATDEIRKAVPELAAWLRAE